MQLWDPAAVRDPFPDAGTFIADPYRVCLHTTEGSSYAGARAAYKANRVSPHFTVSYETGHLQIWQHVALDRAATALEHRAGTVHTNRLSAVQIEVVAMAAKPAWPAGLVAGVSDLIRWIMDQTGVKPIAPTFEPYPASYGEHNGVRFSDADWLTFNGICGHQHVPHQSHGDPGAINILALLPAPTIIRPAAVTDGPALVPTPVHDYEEAATKTTMIHVGKLDGGGNGYADWDPGLGRDPIIVGLVLLGPSPPDDNPPYWDQQKSVNLSAQPRGGRVRVTVRGGQPGDTVSAFVTVA